MAGAMLLLTCSSFAGTVNKLNINSRISVKKNCISGVCADTLRTNSTSVLEGTISPAEAAAFGPETIIMMESPNSNLAPFKLGDVPTYKPGATSIVYTNSTVSNGLTIRLTYRLSWGNGRVLANFTSSVSGVVPGGLLSSDTLAGLSTTTTPKGEAVEKLVPGYPVTLNASNNGTSVFFASAVLKANTKTSETEEESANGDIKRATTYSIRGNQLALP